MDDQTVQDFFESRYDIKDEFARGGMGLIYKTYEKNLHRNLAMKVLIDSEETDPEEIKRNKDYFLEEALITAQLEHPNVVPVHDLGEFSPGNPYFTMKLVRGETLDHVIQKLAQGDEEYIKKYSLIKRLLIFRKVCDAIAFAHANNIIHRDIKPENIMVGNYGEVLMMDWGLAKYIGKEKNEWAMSRRIHSLRSQGDFTQTDSDEVLGTPLYISPEQIDRDSATIDQQSDVYLLGGTLYHLITFFAPHTGANLTQILRCSLQGKIIPPQKRNPSQQIPSELEMIVMKALALEKQDRYPTVEDFSADLDAFIAGEIASTPVRFKKGETIIRQGDEGSEAYVILKGQVDIFQRREEKEFHIATVESGSVVGEMAIISSKQRSASVIAKEDTEVLVVNKQRMGEVLKKLPPWMERIILNLVDRLRTTAESSHPLLLGDPTYHIFHQLACHVLSHAAFQQRLAHVEDIEFSVEQTTAQISNTLCIPSSRVEPLIQQFVDSDACIREGNLFRLKDFTLFSHIIQFLHKEKKADLALPIHFIPRASIEIKAVAKRICEELLDSQARYVREQRQTTIGRRLKDFFGI